MLAVESREKVKKVNKKGYSLGSEPPFPYQISTQCISLSLGASKKY
jgi:hypothetical protein